MKRTFKIIVGCLFSLVVGGVANASPPVAPPTKLGACVAACEVTLQNICFDENNRDLSKLCAKVPECEGQTLTPGDLAAAAALLEACYIGVTTNCPKNCPKGGGNAKPPKTRNLTTPQTRRPPPPPRAKDQCESVGGFYVVEQDPKDPTKTVKNCYTHQGVYTRLVQLENELKALNARVKVLEDNGEAIPFDLRTDYDRHLAVLRNIDKGIVNTQSDIKRLTENMTIQFNRLGARLDALEKRINDVENTANRAEQKADQALAHRGSDIAPALTGWSLTPYATFQLQQTLQEVQSAGGLELGVYPSLSRNGRNRLAIQLGVGKADDYHDQSMMQHHVYAGYAYFAPAGSVMLGGGVNRYSLTDVQQGRLFWAGPVVQGRVNVVDLKSPEQTGSDGPKLFLNGLAGAGYRWARHGVIDTDIEPVQGRFDMTFMLGIGLGDISFF
jgi:hypothetical protein